MKTLKTLTTTILLSSALFSAYAKPLEIQTFNPLESSIFPVSSNLVLGDQDAILIDAQLHKKDAEQLVKMIQDSQKNLTTIYISHFDPDYYFGLDTLTAAFPNAKVIATPTTVEAIQNTKDAKLGYWGPVLQTDAPNIVITPEALSGDKFTLEGEEIIIKGLEGKTPERSFVWIPSNQAIVGGIVVFDNTHVWIADTQTKESRDAWLESLQMIKNLQPTTVIPGHYYEASNKNIDAVNFTEKYLIDFENANSSSQNADELIAQMKALYPNLKGEQSLEMSAKVIKGEMPWP